MNINFKPVELLIIIATLEMSDDLTKEEKVIADGIVRKIYNKAKKKGGVIR